MTQGKDRTRAAINCGASRLPAHASNAGINLFRVPARKLEGLGEVTHVGAHTGPTDATKLALIKVGSQPREIPLQLDNAPTTLQPDEITHEVGNASYYYSLTRLQTLGEIYRDGQRFTVTGESWLDREWSTSALGTDQAGWDWFSLQLHDGHEVMFYRLRKKSGETDAHSAGKWVLPEGAAQTLASDDVKLKPLRYWQAASGARYPVAWEMSLRQQGKRWRIEAVVDDQLMETGITYWEGAVRVVDADNGKLLGQGYLEMSGYQ